MDKKHIQHLYWRAGFGLNPQELSIQENKNRSDLIDELFLKSAKPKPLTVNTSEFNRFNSKMLNTNKEARKEFNKLNTSKINELNYSWIYRLVNSDQILREKMTLFWSNHFVCRDNNIIATQKYNNTLRKYALGNFKDFVKAISKESAMIKYLNLNQNIKRKPNENFARELLELFTLGIGNYSEKDIKEAARAFTGYKTNLKAKFIFKKNQHDTGLKTFLNREDNFNGDQIIDVILEEKQCSKFICEKIYAYFVNENLNVEHIESMANVFYKNYNIEQLMRFVFSSDWFYNKDNIGSKIKSPIEFLVGMHKVIPLKFNSRKELLKMQSVLNQKLLFPPNVAGWQGGRHWITTNSILVRVKLPSMILERESYSIKAKGDFTKTFQFAYVKNKFQDKLDVSVDWKSYKKNVKKLKSEEFLSSLILCNVTPGTEKYLKSIGRLTKKRNLVKIMSLPEYQMC
ncbi:MAG: DUF1800 domain-containing protein [Bacteroidia bacterium]|nr:DUF1800 domain-containing protein [Bacteroidia bacterium]